MAAATVPEGLFFKYKDFDFFKFTASLLVLVSLLLCSLMTSDLLSIPYRVINGLELRFLALLFSRDYDMS